MKREPANRAVARRSLGFGLIELMIAMVLGLIVLGLSLIHI